MAGNYSQMTLMEFFNLLIIFTTLGKVCKVVKAIDGHSQAFIQTDSQLRYLVDGVPIHLHENLINGGSSISFTDVDDDSIHTYASPIRFQPPDLDFKEHPVGMPFIEKVVVINPSSDTSIHMLSISGSTTEFHCSFFVDKSIPPGSNTTFDVVFLGRQEGIIENTLFIHTSLGSFKYQVKAVAVANPYRLRPFLGVKMPLNSSYSPVIHMHNPYSSTLQVTEMYSSAGDLHLELPTGEMEASRHVWEIPPFETKPVMRASFIGRIENNHTAYIRIKTNSSYNDNLILPVEVEVSSVHGIYSPTEVLDFGVLRSHDPVKTLSLNLINYGQKHIHIHNVIVAPVNDAVTVDFQAVKVPPDSLHSTQIAIISFNPAKVFQMKQHSGKIVVKSKNTQFKLTIPYQVTMLQGSLSHDEGVTKFYLAEQSSKAALRNLSVSNSFNVSVIIHNAALSKDANRIFKIHNFRPVVLAPGETATILELELNMADVVNLSSFLRLFTNISFFDIPIVCYDGRLKKLTVPPMSGEHLDFGSLSIGEKRDLFVVLVNENPVEVIVKAWRSNFTKSYVELVGVDKGNMTEVASKLNFSSLSRSTIVRPNHFIVFKVAIFAPEIQGISHGEITLKTQFEAIRIPFSFWSVTGSLSADVIVFENTFPGKISWKNLQIHSTFSHAMTITSVEAFPHDARFSFEPLKTTLSVLKPEGKSVIGKLYFDPMKECLPTCYTGMPINAPMGERWLSGMSLPADVGNIDTELYTIMNERWTAFQSSGKNSMNGTLKLNTNEVRGFSLSAQVNFQWPRIANKQKIKFPLTQIGNQTIREFTLENPSGLPVIAQVLLLPMYPNPQKILDVLQLKLLDALEMENSDVFTLQDTEQHNPKLDNPIPSYRRSIQEYFRVQPLQTSIALMLTPGMRVRIRVGFAPKNEELQTSVVLIRNNLTILDTVVIQGQGGYGQLVFGSKKASTPLYFEMTEKHLKDCNRMKISQQVPPNFTVKRAFSAKNTGELSVYVKDFAINGSPCEGFGFKVMNCQSFELLPNTSRKIDVAFTPDFTLSRVQRTLNIYTSLTPGGLILNYSLVATIPPHLMVQCGGAIPRPGWEPLLYYSALGLMVFLLVCILLAAYFESDRIFKYRFITMATSAVPNSEHVYEKSKVFDLKNMVFRNAEFRSSYANDGGGGGNSSSSSSEKRRKSTTPPSSSNQSSSSSSTSNVCSNILNLAPEFFKKKKSAVQSNNSWTQSSKNVFASRSLKEKDVCNNNIGKSFDYETDSSSTTNRGGGGGHRKNSKRLGNNDFSSSQSDNCNEKAQNGAGSHSLSSWNGSLKSGSETNEKEEKRRHHEEQECSMSEKVKVKQQNNLSRSTSPPKRDLSNDSKPNSRGGKVVEIPAEDSLSTTTESSSADDVIDKHQEVLLPVKVNNRTRNLRLKTKIQESEKIAKKMESIDNSNDDGGDFELSTKSKGHRKIKVDHTRGSSGDILRPNSLELPYKLKSPVANENSEKISKGGGGGSTTKSKKILVCKSKGPLHILASENNIKGKISHVADWDQPKSLNNTDDAFSELAKQTEIFAQKHRRPSSDRHSSYSEIVSDGRHKNPLPPVGKMVTTPTTTPPPDTQRKEFKYPGTIGQRLPYAKATASNTTTITPPPHPPASNSSNNNSSWGATMLSPATPQTPTSPIGLFFPSDLSKTDVESSDQGLDENCQRFGRRENLSLGSLWQSNWGDEQQNNQRAGDWNFGVNLLDSGSVWKNTYNPDSDLWLSKDLFSYSSLANKNSAVATATNTTTAVNPIFDSSRSLWSTNLWPNSNASSTSTSSEGGASPLGCATLTPVDVGLNSPNSSNMASARDGREDSCPEFDPFRTPHDIWSPPSSPLTRSENTDGDHSWAFSLFANKNAPN